MIHQDHCVACQHEYDHGRLPPEGFRQVPLQQVYLYVWDSPSTAPDVKYLYERHWKYTNVYNYHPVHVTKYHDIDDLSS